MSEKNKPDILSDADSNKNSSLPTKSIICLAAIALFVFLSMVFAVSLFAVGNPITALIATAQIFVLFLGIALIFIIVEKIYEKLQETESGWTIIIIAVLLFIVLICIWPAFEK